MHGGLTVDATIIAEKDAGNCNTMDTDYNGCKRDATNF